MRVLVVFLLLAAVILAVIAVCVPALQGRLTAAAVGCLAAAFLVPAVAAV